IFQADGLNVLVVDAEAETESKTNSQTNVQPDAPMGAPRTSDQPSPASINHPSIAQQPSVPLITAHQQPATPPVLPSPKPALSQLTDPRRIHVYTTPPLRAHALRDLVASIASLNPDV